MSALPPKADMCGATRDVRFGPIADSCSAAKSALFDHRAGSARIFGNVNLLKEPSALYAARRRARRSVMRVRSFVCCVLLNLVTAAPFAFAEEQASISRLPPLPQQLDPI